MHFDPSISLGNILTILAVIGGLFRMDRIAAKYLIEHEILIADYCKRMGIDIDGLPTRMKGLFR